MINWALHNHPGDWLGEMSTVRGGDVGFSETTRAYSQRCVSQASGWSTEGIYGQNARMMV